MRNLPLRKVEKLTAADFFDFFEDLSIDERNIAFDFVKLADVVLQEFRCRPEIKKFMPVSTHAIYTVNNDMSLWRKSQIDKESTSDLWKDVNDSEFANSSSSVYAQLCFNFQNPLVQKLMEIKNQEILILSIRILYLQTLLLGNYPLQPKELAMLNNGLLELIL